MMVPHLVKYREKYGYQKNNIVKNKLMLEDVMLKRLVKREMNLEKRK